MTKVVFVGEIYNADLGIGGGPIYPPVRPPSGPVDPGWSGGVAPPPHIWGGYRPPYVDIGLPGPQPRPPGAPVDPGWSGGVGQPGSRPPIGAVDPGWGWRPPVDPGWSGGVAPPNVIGGGPIYPSGPVDPGWSGGVAPPPGIWGGPGALPPGVMPPIYIPAQPVLPDSGDPTKAHLVVYVPGVGAVSFTVDLTALPEPTPPTEPEPK